jgi:F0F1-type ATP synthase epsilon subunit
MRDGRFATPRFNAAVDVAHVQKPGAKLLGESAERKKDFSEISAYRNSITRRGNRRHAAEQRDELATGHWMTAFANALRASRA